MPNAELIGVRIPEEKLVNKTVLPATPSAARWVRLDFKGATLLPSALKEENSFNLFTRANKDKLRQDVRGRLQSRLLLLPTAFYNYQALSS